MNVIAKENMDATSKRHIQGLGTVLRGAGAPEHAEFENRMPERIRRKAHACSDWTATRGGVGVSFGLTPRSRWVHLGFCSAP